MSDLIERLRESDNDTEYVSPIGNAKRPTLAWESAEAIERLTAENGALYSHREALLIDLAASLKREDALRAAIEPFAEYDETYPPGTVPTNWAAKALSIAAVEKQP